MKALLIYSPFACKGRFEKYLPSIEKRLQTKYDLKFAKTDYELHATELASDACGVFDVVIIAGGDGLINEVINGIAGKENKPCLVLIPAGTVNDIAHSLKISKNINKALSIILNGNKKQIDCFKTNNFCAGYVVCSGKHTKSTYNTKQKNKAKFGWFAYFYEAVKELFSKDKYEFEVSLNDEQLQGKFIFVMFINSRYVAGFKLNKHAKLNDGQFDAVLIKQTKGFFSFVTRYINFLKMFLFGINSVKNSKQFVVRTVKKAIVLNNSRSHFNIDGECGNTEEKIEVSMLQKEISFIVK